MFNKKKTMDAIIDLIGLKVGSHQEEPGRDCKITFYARDIVMIGLEKDSIYDFLSELANKGYIRELKDCAKESFSSGESLTVYTSTSPYLTMTVDKNFEEKTRASNESEKFGYRVVCDGLVIARMKHAKTASLKASSALVLNYLYEHANEPQKTVDIEKACKLSRVEIRNAIYDIGSKLRTLKYTKEEVKAILPKYTAGHYILHY